MIKIPLCLMIFLVGSILIAADLKTKSGKIYENYNIDTATPAGLTIFHNNGASTIPYSDLPDELRNRYRTEEDQAAELQKKRLRQLEEYQKEFQKQQEKRNNRRKIKEQEQKLFTSASGICGVNIGENLSNYTVLKQVDPYMVQLKLPKQFQQLDFCQVGITKDGIIYEIILREENVEGKKRQTESFLQEMKRSFPEAQTEFINEKNIGRFFANFPPRTMELTFQMPEKLESGEESPGFWQLKFTDESQKPVVVRHQELLNKKESIWYNGVTVLQVLNGAVLAQSLGHTIYIDDIDTQNLVDGNELFNHTIYTNKLWQKAPDREKFRRQVFRCWPIGTYRYINVMGSSQTIKRYTADPKKALEYYTK